VDDILSFDCFLEFFLSNQTFYLFCFFSFQSVIFVCVKGMYNSCMLV